ncbi:hypothetical protein Glove_461g43 [Diversispora epigaea]|uniref:Uncharacterized protein n=1 Tax=Diversispora epigaea TaxID=1348612 RepID=A0A397GN29_9GLOM|nr:hypothetical protein Glove_461g43 [Diversispora epigaea]
MAPETLNGGEYSQTSDIFSFEFNGKCWHVEPLNHPTAKELKYQPFKYYYNELEEQINADEMNKNFIQYDPNEVHPEAIYTNRLIPKFAKPENYIFIEKK